ncbi:MAG: hypothetical protein H0V66_15995, partial [Bdellovibrionales bacterium]|nr:hypothetical protein [Bdellovibrionales bacterium]
DMLVKSQDYFQIYNQKNAQEIDDGKYDESEFFLFSQVDQINGLDIIFSKEDIRNTKTKMIILITESFDSHQIEAIARVARSTELNKKQAATFFEVALEYKLGKLKLIKFPLRR